MADFFWHLWNDPMRDNPWSWVAMLLLFALLFGLHEIGYRLERRRNRRG